MRTLVVMVLRWLRLLAGMVGTWATVMKEYVKAQVRSMNTSTSTTTGGYWATSTDLVIAEYFVVKYRTQAEVSGHYQAAKNLRKQGVPLEIAMMILFNRA